METNRENESFLIGQSSALIDHSLLDIEVCSSLKGEVMGRPYCTLLIENQTERVLGIHLSLDKPDYRSAISVLRECFRCYGKLPEQILIDGGKEFQHPQFDAVLNYFGIVKKSPSNFAFKAKLERIFGKISQFLSKL